MILGINISHDAAFCQLDEHGNPIFFVEEERFNRTKHTGFNTLISLDTVIRRGLLNPETVTNLVYSFEMDEAKTTDLMNKCHENVVNSFGMDVFQQASQYFHQPEHQFSPIQGIGLTTDFNEVRRQLSILFPKAQETGYMHHLCHMASAFYPSPFDSAALIIIDGSGRLETTTIWHADVNGYKLLHQTELPHSIGIFYWLFSQYLGLEEGQTMGLAAYGTPVYRDLIYEHLAEIDEEGNFFFKAPIVSWFDMDSEYAIRIIENLFRVPTRSSQKEPLKQFHADVAASIQVVTEEVFVKIARYTKQITGENNLCLAGGVIQNCVANGRLVNEKIFENVWIQPVANDAGTALGAALHHFYAYRKNPSQNRWRMSSAQLGLDFDNRFIKDCLLNIKIDFKESETIADDAARCIADGQIIGWFQGKAEVGPRALGGRSILADARNKFNSFAVNEIKQRHCWRPFAPSVLAERANDFFVVACDSPYMILSFSLVELVQQSIPAISHVNESARIQTVSPDINGQYYNLLKTFEQLTDYPVILNTSFNLKAEPIVQHPLEAVRDFLLSGIDTLFLGNCVIEEKPPIAQNLREALVNCRFIGLYDTYLRGKGTICFLQHKNYTVHEKRLLRRFQILLEWLKITYIEISPSQFESYFSSENSLRNLISIAHLQDEKLLRDLPTAFHERMIISVLDNQMFLSQTTVEDFLRLIESNRQKLHSLVAEKIVFVWWAEEGDSNDILDSLSLLNIEFAGIISRQEISGNYNCNIKRFSPEILRHTDENMFLILPFSVMDNHKSELRKLGYHTGQNYLVWEDNHN